MAWRTGRVRVREATVAVALDEARRKMDAAMEKLKRAEERVKKI